MAKKADSTLVSSFLQSVTDINISLHEKVYDHCNILIVICGLILTLSLTQLSSVTPLGRIGFSIIAITSGLSAIICILILRPKNVDNPLNRMYYGGILKTKNEKDYIKELLQITKDNNKIIENFAREMYDLAPILRYKYRLVKTVVDIFVIGLIIGAFVVFLSI
ncbi:MAG: Pycsar system effector family protein [Candidatus Aenigmatarchaeota archaeon]